MLHRVAPLIAHQSSGTTRSSQCVRSAALRTPSVATTVGSGAMPKISACSHGRPSSRPTSGQANSAKTKMQSPAAPRSEEHTSELQSQSNLVCRLLLEKKKDNNSFKTPFAVHELVATVLSSNCA